MDGETIALVRRLVAAGGVLKRGADGWRVEGTGEGVAASTVGRLWRAKLLTGKRRSGRAEATAEARRLGSWPGRPLLPAVGTTVTFRDCGYRPRAKGGTFPGRYLEGRVVVVLDWRRLLVVARGPSGAPVLWEPVRGTPHARWKAHGPVPLGWFAPGRHRHDAGSWALLMAVPGLVPTAWTSEPAGAPCSMERFRWAAARLSSIGAEPATDEERAAMLVFHRGADEVPALAGLRRHADVHGRFAPGVAAILEKFVAENAAAVHAAEVAELVKRVELVAWHEIVKPRMDAELAARRAALRSSPGCRRRDQDVPDATLAEVRAALAPEIDRGAIDPALLPEAFAINRARIDARRAELGARRKGEAKSA